jgi:hypothetical protein
MSQLIATAKAKIQVYTENAAALARPRVTGSPRVIINKDSMGRGFGGMGGGWR